jgi:hypothetical protein
LYIGSSANGTSLEITAAGALNVGGAATFSSTVSATQLTSTSSSPSLPAFAVSSGNGLYNSGTNQVAISTAGTERMRIDSAGKIQIGNNIPMWSGSYGGALFLKGNNATSDRYAQLAIVDSAGAIASQGLIVNTSGNVGIGTTTPAYQLTLSSNPSFWEAGLQTEVVGGTQVLKIVSDAFGGGGRTGNIEFHVNSVSASPAVKIDSAGNLGLGMTPSAWASNAHIIDFESSDVGAQASVGDFGGTAFIGQNFYYGAGYTRKETGYASRFYQYQAAFLWQNAGTAAGGSPVTWETKMQLSGNGNLLVGTTSPYNYSGIAPLLTIDNSAGIGIRNVGASDAGYSTIPSANHNYYAGFFLNSSGAGVGNILCTANSTAYNTSSDYRLKENIADADDAGSKIDAIQVRQYDWKAGGSHQDYGMIAQELLEVAPEAVSVPEDSEKMMGVDYSKLVPMMLKEIQSLRARINALEAE